MSEVLIKTKLNVPVSGPGIISRPRLDHALDDGLGRRLTLVAAPAGFGKTTAVAEWLRQKGCSAGWVSLDSSDNDPVRFYSYFAAALEAALPGISHRLTPFLPYAGSFPPETFISILIDDLASLPRDLILVLDDYQLIQEALVHESLSFLIEYMPEHTHIVLISRVEPPLSLPRLRVRGHLKVLNAADLRFNPDEVALFYRKKDIHLTGGQLRKLEACTEGWAAGLQSAVWSILGNVDITGAIEGFSGKNRYIAAYLTDEVFDKWTQAHKEFFLETSILERLTGPLCDAVTGRSGGAELLEMLVRTNSFVFSLDEDGCWYRYHHLFAEYLYGLLQERMPSRLAGLHQKATEWYENNGFIVEAVNHCMRGKDFSRAALLIERHASEILTGRATITLQEWLRALPEALVNRSIILCLAYAWTGILTEQPSQKAGLQVIKNHIF